MKSKCQKLTLKLAAIRFYQDAIYELKGYTSKAREQACRVPLFHNYTVPQGNTGRKAVSQRRSLLPEAYALQDANQIRTPTTQSAAAKRLGVRIIGVASVGLHLKDLE